MPSTEQLQLDLSLKTLGIETNCTWSDIEKHYRALVQTWHPDRYSGNDDAYAQDRFIEINSAFKLLRECYRKTGTVPTLSSAKAIPPKRPIDFNEPIGSRFSHHSTNEPADKNHVLKIAALFAGLLLLISLFWLLDSRTAENNRERALMLKTNNSTPAQSSTLDTSQLQNLNTESIELTNADNSLLP